KKIVSTMDEVVVSAGRVEEKKKELTSNVLIIDEEEVKNSSARDVGDLLAEKGIGHIQKYPGALTSIGIRGFRTETHGNDLKGHVLILLNGRRAATGNVAKLMTRNIERIEIIRGPASVQYGSAAMGGIVNVITKQGKGKPSVFAEGILGSFDHEEWSVGGSGKLKGFDFSGSFTSETMDDYDDADGNKYRNTGNDEITNFSVNLGLELLPKNRFGIIFTNFDADKGGNPSYMSLNDLDDYTDKKNKSVDLIYDGGTPNGPFTWKARYFHTEDTDKWSDPVLSDPSGWDNGVPTERKTDQKGAQVQASFDSDIFLVTAGYDWVHYNIDATWNPIETEYENPAYFLLAKARLFDRRFIISGGVRYDKYDVTVESNQGTDQSDSNVSPHFGVAYLITDYLKLRANYGEAFMMPSADQLAADYNVWGTRTLGNPNLDPEKSRTYEGGIDFSCGFFDSALTYFHTDFKDKIEQIAKPGPINTWENIDDATIEGVEGEFSFDIGAFFGWDYEIRPYASFVYLTEFKDEATNRDLNYTSDLHVSYGITVSDSKGLSANLNFAYTGEQHVEDWENYAWPAPVAVIKKGDFTVANFTISKKILDFDKYGGLTLRGEIQNLFDREYEYVKGYPMPGRSFFVGMRYDF
ncbi:MAG: TonB-dependent receptor, partial [Deltaproteobacteria bacterium]|nr:TonB-dependent receptor [Deltaproteobacteria bacterium]